MQTEKHETEAAGMFKEFRSEQGVTQVGLSVLLGIPQARVSRIENNGIVDHEEFKEFEAKIAKARKASKAKNGSAK